MQDLPHNGAQRHLCKLYQNLPPRPRRGVHSPWQILLWLWGGHSEQPVSLTGWTHPGHRHTLWLCSPHRISHAASQLTSADFTHHLLLCVCGHECMQKRERVCVCVCMCVCVLACSAVTPICATFSDATCVATMGVAVLSMWLLRVEEQKCLGLTPDICCASVSIAVVGSWPDCVPCDERQTLSAVCSAVVTRPMFVAGLWNRVTGQDVTCREGCGAGCPGWNFVASLQPFLIQCAWHTSFITGLPTCMGRPFLSGAVSKFSRLWSLSSLICRVCQRLFHKCLLCF